MKEFQVVNNTMGVQGVHWVTTTCYPIPVAVGELRHLCNLTRYIGKKNLQVKVYPADRNKCSQITGLYSCTLAQEQLTFNEEDNSITDIQASDKTWESNVGRKNYPPSKPVQPTPRFLPLPSRQGSSPGPGIGQASRDRVKVGG